MVAERSDAEQVIRELGGVGALRRQLSAYKRDRAYLDGHWAELIKKHKDEWVAVLGAKVVVHHSNLDELVKLLVEDDIDPSHAVIDFVTSEPLNMLLPFKRIG